MMAVSTARAMMTALTAAAMMLSSQHEHQQATRATMRWSQHGHQRQELQGGKITTGINGKSNDGCISGSSNDAMKLA